MSALRAGTILVGFMALTVPLMPVQAVLVRLAPGAARRFPHWYHRQVCRLIGVRLHIAGEVATDRPVLLVSNHTSWLDIPVLSAVAPLSFIAKKEVAAWPFVSWLAKLQRTVFVDRTRRTAVGETAREIAERLTGGDTIVLFAEGTSSDGNRVLPFMSSLFAAAHQAQTGATPGAAHEPAVQTVSLVYTHLAGIPLGRADRPIVGWYGDMEMQEHAWTLLKSGALDVRIVIGPPAPISSFASRKALAEATESAVREGVVRTLRARGPDETVETVSPPEPSKRPQPPRRASSAWT